MFNKVQFAIVTIKAKTLFKQKIVYSIVLFISCGFDGILLRLIEKIWGGDMNI